MVKTHPINTESEIALGKGIKWNQNPTKRTWNYEVALWDYVWKRTSWEGINYICLSTIFDENQKKWKYS